MMRALLKVEYIGIPALFALALFSSGATGDPIRDCEDWDVQRSIKGCTELLQQKPRHARALYKRAAAYQRVDRYKEAIEDYNAAIEIDDTNPAFFHDRGMAYGELGDMDRALRDLNIAVKLRPDENNAIRSLVYARARANKELPEALADANRLIELDAKQAKRFGASFHVRSFVYYRLGRWREAIVDADTAISLHGNFAGSFFVRGKAKIAAGDRQGGNKDIAAALNIDPDIADTFAKYGVK
jgi:tetratricopeptide (TPR) repeat protein